MVAIPQDIEIALAVLACTVCTALAITVYKNSKQKKQLLDFTRSLERANLRLKELDQQKTDFLSIVSHQLRTPLSILKGYLELMQDGVYGKIPEKVNPILDDMNETNERLVTLVDEFLDVTRIEQDRIKFNFEENDIYTIIESVLKELKQKVKSKHLLIERPPALSLEPVIMDKEKIRHVIFNFVDNAIKYSDSGSIAIDVTPEENGLVVRVTDQGFGFVPEDEVNFFQKFYRGKNVERTNVNGNGLGIYVCKKFIEAHGGEVWAKSPGLGQGSEFGFWIPLQPKGMEKSI